ncbi:hypothetical protein AVEN_37384-1 [Araneus ventricosus]|uniref:Uncharacterized protein n=1 Tax=Araneus ventricosus TaxID=182803 RepID=A0A4Y2LFU8_ARAVE|nr:hypothetical protein AVEN_37384-1 [Araneus ventricosus]
MPGTGKPWHLSLISAQPQFLAYQPSISQPSLSSWHVSPRYLSLISAQPRFLACRPPISQPSLSSWHRSPASVPVLTSPSSHICDHSLRSLSPSSHVITVSVPYSSSSHICDHSFRALQLIITYMLSLFQCPTAHRLIYVITHSVLCSPSSHICDHSLRSLSPSSHVITVSVPYSSSSHICYLSFRALQFIITYMLSLFQCPTAHRLINVINLSVHRLIYVITLSVPYSSSSHICYLSFSALQPIVS